MLNTGVSKYHEGLITLDILHGAQSDVGNREGQHENKVVCGKSGGQKSLRNMKNC